MLAMSRRGELRLFRRGDVALKLAELLLKLVHPIAKLPVLAARGSA